MIRQALLIMAFMLVMPHVVQASGDISIECEGSSNRNYSHISVRSERDLMVVAFIDRTYLTKKYFGERVFAVTRMSFAGKNNKGEMTFQDKDFTMTLAKDLTSLVIEQRKESIARGEPRFGAIGTNCR